MVGVKIYFMSIYKGYLEWEGGLGELQVRVKERGVEMTWY